MRQSRISFASAKAGNLAADAHVIEFVVGPGEFDVRRLSISQLWSHMRNWSGRSLTDCLGTVHVTLKFSTA